MKKIAVITGDPELENYVSKTSKRTWLTNWASRIDTSIVKYLEKNSNYDITNVDIKNINEKVFEENDLIFYNMVDPAAANILSKNIANKLSLYMTKYSKKVYPPSNFGKLLENKCDYYKYLENKKIPVVPFFCITAEEYQRKKGRDYYESIYNKIVKQGWKGFIGKPVLGTSGIGFRMYPDINNVSKYEFFKQLEKQMDYVFEKHHFPMLLFQEKHEEFGSGDIPEVKMYYLNGKFIYSWVTSDNKYVLLGKGNKTSKYYLSPEKVKHCKAFANNVIKVIKPLFNGLPLPLLRIDLGCCLNYTNTHTVGQMFLNEIEYAPAFILAKLPGKSKMHLDEKIAKQFINIANAFFKKNSNSKNTQNSSLKLNKPISKLQNKQTSTKKYAILDRNPRIADDKMKFKRSWMPDSNPTSYLYNKYVWSPEVSSYWYIKKFHKNINIDLIPFEKITDKNLMASYNKIFIINHGLSDITPFWKENAQKYINSWKALGDKAYPPYRLANFVYDKCSYYDYLQSNGIKTAATLCYTNKSTNSNVNKFVDNYKLNKIFVKPVGGDSGLATSTHNSPFNNLKPTLRKMIQDNGWKKIVVQKHMNFSSKTNPEYKCLFIGDELQYIIKSIYLGVFGGLIKPKDTYWPHKDKIIKMSLQVKKLFEKAMNTKLFIYRVDWGYDKNTKEFFLNELEHAPGWYCEDIIHEHEEMTSREWKSDVKLAKQIIKFVN